MTSSNNHFKHHQKLLADLHQACKGDLPFNSDQCSDTDMQFLKSLELIAHQNQADEDYLFKGQEIITFLIGHYSHLTDMINRDLLWYFGGDCLHFMADEEIDKYQKLDELLFNEESGTLAYSQAKAAIFKLH